MIGRGWPFSGIKIDFKVNYDCDMLVFEMLFLLCNC